MTTAMRHRLFLLYVIALGVSFVVFLVLLFADAYVRWAINQNFSFMSGTGLLPLAILNAAQFAGLAYFLKD
jgi:hypothetical protein